jgi:hypothetical protein
VRLALRRRSVAVAPSVAVRCKLLALPCGMSTEEHASSTAAVSPRPSTRRAARSSSRTRCCGGVQIVRSTRRRTPVACRRRARVRVSVSVHTNAAALLVPPNYSIERTATSALRALAAAAHVERSAPSGGGA